MNGKPTTSGREWVNRVTQSRPRVHLTEQVSHEEVQEKAAFNSEEIEKIRGLLGSLNKPSGACSLTLSGNSWIVDLGATDHMTHTLSHFSTYTPCPSNRKIIVANGSLVTVAGVGDIFITPNLVLKDVLHVPKLSANLISIQKLTKDLHCQVIFYPFYCVFQDQDSERRIGLAKEQNGLYYLETPLTAKRITNTLSSSFLSTSNKEAIWLHHFRFSHPSFQVLSIMFPSLFKGLNIKDFHCDVCELTKRNLVPFPISNRRSSNPFDLIHSDIWGPSTIPNISGAR